MMRFSVFTTTPTSSAASFPATSATSPASFRVSLVDHLIFVCEVIVKVHSLLVIELGALCLKFLSWVLVSNLAKAE